MTLGSVWDRAVYGKSVRTVRQSGPSGQPLVRLDHEKRDSSATSGPDQVGG